MPREVTAGVPMRTPLVTNGERGSNGTVFLLTVMRARSSVSSATLPVSSLPRRSIIIRWLSVPPVSELEAALDQAVGQRLRVRDDLPLVGLERRRQRLA